MPVYPTIYNPDWEHWKSVYPGAYQKYKDTRSFGVARIPTPADRPVPEGYYQWPRWYATGGMPSEKNFYSFPIWPDDGSGKQRMGMYPGVEYPFPPPPPAQETVTVPEDLTEENLARVQEFYRDPEMFKEEVLIVEEAPTPKPLQEKASPMEDQPTVQGLETGRVPGMSISMLLIVLIALVVIGGLM